LPLDDAPYLDDDSDTSFGFEIGIDNAGYSKEKRRDSDNSFDRNDQVIEINDDLNMNDFLNSSGNKRGNGKFASKNVVDNNKN
jgi:hypothetical protein